MPELKTQVANKNRETVSIFIKSGLVASVSLLFLFQLNQQDLTGAECRIGLFIREMIERGIGFYPTTYGTIYPDYPPLYFWIGWLGSKLIGLSTFTVVFPSIVGGVLSLLGVHRLGRIHSGETGGLKACLFLFSLPLFWSLCQQASIDMLLTASLIWAFYFFYQGIILNKGVYFTGAGLLAAFISALIKGMLGPAIIAIGTGSTLLFQKRWRCLIKFSVQIFLVCVLFAVLWYGGIYIYLGKQEAMQVFSMQGTSRVAKSLSNSGLLDCVLTTPAITFPWIVPALLLFSSNILRREILEKPLVLVCSFWFISVFFIFSIAETLHTRYLLLLLPPVAVMASLYHEHPAVSRLYLRLECFMARILWLVSPLILVLPFLISEHWNTFDFWWRYFIVFSCLCVVIIYFPWKTLAHQISWKLIASVSLLGLVVNIEFIEPYINHRVTSRPAVLLIDKKVPESSTFLLYKIRPDSEGIHYMYFRIRPTPPPLISNQKKLKKILSGLQEAYILMPDEIHKNEFPGFLEKSSTFEGTFKLRGKEECALIYYKKVR